MVTDTWPEQGDIWWAEAEDKRRPVLVVTRSDIIGALHTIVIAPVTRTIRNIPTEIPLDDRHGLPDECVATFDNLQPIRRSYLTHKVGGLAVGETSRICDALRALADC